MAFKDRYFTKLEEELGIWFQDKHTKYETWVHFKTKYDVSKIVRLIDDMERCGILEFNDTDQRYKLSVKADVEMDIGV